MTRGRFALSVGFPARISRGIAAALLLALLAGCNFLKPERQCAPVCPESWAETVGGNGYRPPSADLFQSLADRLQGQPPPARADNRMYNVLALSGGGKYGAFSAGVLGGWTESGARPNFDVVTGVSTGSLIAAVTFLGPEYDDAAREFYTSIRASDIYTRRAWIFIPGAGSVTSSEPLRKLIASIVDERFLEHIAAGHRRGRRLYVGTTNLESRKLVTWDMGAIASRGGPDSVEQFRTVLLASCSVPGMMPPVPMRVARNGKTYKELHTDGGTTAQLFVPPGIIATKPDGSPSGTDIHIVVAGKLFADHAPVKRRILPVLGASATSIIHSHCRAEIANIFLQAKLTGGKFWLTALPESDNGQPLGLDFDPKEMARLYEVGYCHGIGGPAWITAPPFEGAATDPPRE